MITTQKNTRWYDYISINLFWLGLNIRNNAFGSVFMPYLVGMFVSPEIRNTALGEMRTAGLVIAMLVQPAMGLLSDRSTSRFGRRRPYIFVGVLLDILFLAAVALSWNYWALLFATLLLQFSSNISHGPLQALIPDLVPEDKRGLASGIKAIFELLPLVLIAFTIAKLVGLGHFTWAVVVTALFELATMILTIFLVKEEPLAKKPETPFWPPMVRVLGMLAGIILGALSGAVCGALVGGLAGLSILPFSDSKTALAVGVGAGGLVAMIAAIIFGVWAGIWFTLSKDARRNPSFTWWVVNRLMFLAAATSLQGFLQYFLMHAFKMSPEVSVQQSSNLIMVAGLFTIVTAIPGGWLSDRFGHQKLVTVSGLLGAAGTALLLLTIWMPNMIMLSVIGAIIGLATGLFMTANWALGTSLVPQREAGRYLGIANLAGAGAGMIGAGLGGPIADYLNQYTPGMGYFAVFAYYGVLFLLSAFIVRWVKVQHRNG
jgi:MFS family permease